MGHDQWSAFYNHYVVRKSTITVYVNSSVTANTCSQVFGITLDDDNSFSATTFQYACELPGSICQLIESGQQWTKKLSMTYDAKKFHNVKDVKDHDDLKANFGASPAENSFFYCWSGALDGSTNVGILDLLVTIDYEVIVSEPKDIGQS